MSLYKKTASEIAEMIKNKEITSEEVTNSFLDRIEKTEEKIGAFSNVFPEKALDEAKKYDSENNEEARKNYDNEGIKIELLEILEAELLEIPEMELIELENIEIGVNENESDPEK